MITLPGLAAEALGSFLASDMKDRFGASHARLAELIPFAARLALECIGNSDALYHNVEHTMLVTLAGHDIFKGRALLKHRHRPTMRTLSSPAWRMILGTSVASSKATRMMAMLSMGLAARFRCRADAALGPYHVERSQLFVLDRVAAVEELDSARIASAIGFTQFPYASPTDEKEDEQGIDEVGSLLRAADLIGQLGDPHYLRKANALYYEFEEIGLNRQFGYESPADIVDKYPQFYWNNISPHIQTAINYLNVTSSGRWWIAGLYSNVFRAERELRHSGPQP